MSEPVLSGALARDGAVEILRRIEDLRTTGVLRFTLDGAEVDVALVGGQLALEQPELPDGRDPVEVFLAAESGTYRVLQRLPALPVSRGDDTTRTGSLAVHVPADLMGYCERAGLTGTLALGNGARRAEAVYDRGELVAIRVDGAAESDLHEVFAWEEGTFEIVATPARPPDVVPAAPEEEDDPSAREPTIPRIKRRKDETGQQFLKVVDVALGRIVEEREKRRSPTRTSPPIPDKPRTRPPHATSDRPAERRDATVRVIYLRAPSVPPPEEDTSTRHVRAKLPAGEANLPEASPERRSREGRKMTETETKKDSGSDAPAPDAPAPAAGAVPAVARESLLRTLGWVAIVVVLFIVSIAILARLPAME